MTLRYAVLVGQLQQFLAELQQVVDRSQQLLYSLEIGTLFTPVSAPQLHLSSAGVRPLISVDPYFPSLCGFKTI